MDFKNSLILGSKKFAKGMFALFCMKVLLIGTVTIIQACSADESDFDKGKIDGLKFKNALNLSFGRVEKLIEEGNSTKESQERLMVDNGYTCYPTIDANGNSIELCYPNSQEDEFEEALQPALVEAKNYFYSIGLTQNDLSEALEGQGEENLILAAAILTELNINDLAILNSNERELSLFFDFTYAQSDAQSTPQWNRDRVINCISAALGVNELIGLVSNTAQLATAQGVKQVIKLIARRYIGWIGVALAVYSFGNCMGTS